MYVPWGVSHGLLCKCILALDWSPKQVPARLSLICSCFFLRGKGFLLIDSLSQVQANSAAASSGRRRWPRSLLVFICFLSAEMKELHPFSLDQQVWAHFGLFLTGEGWRLSTWNLKYKPQASRNAGIYCPALLYKMSCVPAPPEFSVFQSLACCSPWTWVVCTLWLRESYCSQTPSARCFFFSLLL